MAPSPKPTASGTREVSPTAGPLDPSEVVDDRDISPREPKPDNAGKMFVKAYPAKGATTLLYPASDFSQYGDFSHPSVTFDFRINSLKVRVGGGDLTEQAAEFLTKRYPNTFKYIQGA